MRTVTNGVMGIFNPTSGTVPYFWFVAVSDCDSTTGLDIESYELAFTNIEYDHWEREFSYDYWGVAQAHIAFIFFYFALAGLHVYGCWQLYRKEAYHPLVKILTTCILLQFIANFFYMLYTFLYSLIMVLDLQEYLLLVNY
jgi:hypothetical protein